MFHEPEDAYRAALIMVDVFASVGADCFDVTLTTIQGEKIRYRPNLPTDDVRRRIPVGLDLAEQHQHNIIIRPRASLRSPEWTAAKKPKRFPDYERCLREAPPNSKGDGQDTSRADFTWCIIAIDWGWSVEETAAQLLKERVDEKKRHRNGKDYADLTAGKAAKAVENNRARGR